MEKLFLAFWRKANKLNTVVSIPKKKPKRRLPNTFVDIHNDIVALLVEVCLKSVILLPCQIAFYEHQSDTKNKNLLVYIFQSAAKKSDLMLLLKAGKKIISTVFMHISQVQMSQKYKLFSKSHEGLFYLSHGKICRFISGITIVEMSSRGKGDSRGHESQKLPDGLRPLGKKGPEHKTGMLTSRKFSQTPVVFLFSWGH